MSDTTGKKKPRRGAKGRGGGRGLPERGEDEERCPEPRRMVQAQPSTPHRAFDKFNESVDNVNIDDIRDMQPEEYSVLYSGITSGIAELKSDEAFGEVSSGDVRPDRSAESKVGTDVHSGSGGGPVIEQKESQSAAVDGEMDETELVRELDACEAEGDEQEPLPGAGHEGGTGDDLLSADRYFYGPTQFGSKQRRGLLSSLRYCSAPRAGGESCADRSSVEMAEALLLGVLGEWGQGQGQRGPDDLHKVSLRESPEGGAPAAVKGGLGGVLGYVLHTLLTLYYRLFVHVPLLLLHWLASHLWSATTSITALAYVVASACLSAVLWACLLPLRTTQRVLAWLWQHSLVLAVDFLNQAPSAFGDARSGPGPHKQAVPTALNGHVHKH